MKKFLTTALAICTVGMLLLPSCKKSGELVVSNGGKAGTLTATSTNLVLDKTKVNDPSTIISFSFTAANYGFKAAITNTLQIDAASDNWANPTSTVLGTGVNTQGYSTADFNNMILKLNLPAGQASQVQIRVAHSVSANVPPVYSNVLNLTVTPFNLTSWVYVPGDYCSWHNPGAGEDSLVSVTGNGVYVGIINFTSGSSAFLITPVKGWANKWATAQGSTATATSATYTTQYVTGGDNNFVAPSTPGQYLLTFDSNNNTLTIQQADYYSIIGDASLGWNPGDDVPLKFINDGNNNWVANNVAMTVATPPNDGWKIRQDDAWSYSWGTGSTPGQLIDSNDTNIGISTAGNYNITFTMAPTIFGTAPVATAPYTIAPAQ